MQHSDLSDEEFTARIGALGKCLESVGAPEPEELAAVPDPVQPDLVHGVIYDQERTIDQNSAGGPAETSLGGHCTGDASQSLSYIRPNTQGQQGRKLS